MAAELKIGIGAETGGLMKGISDALSKISGFQKEAQNAFNKLSTSEIQDTIGKLNSKIKIIDGNVQVFGDSLANSKKALNAYQTAFNDLVGKGLDPASSELQTITEEITRLNSVVSLADNGVNGFKSQMNNLSEGFNKVGTDLSIGLTAPIVGFVTTSLWANKETKTAFDAMKASISTSMGRIGEAIDEALHVSEGFEKIAGFVKDLATTFQNLDPELQKTILVVAGVTAAIGPLLVGVGKFIQMMPIMVEGIGGISKAFTFLLSPIGLVTIGIIGIVTAVVTNWSKITPYLVRTANNFIQLYNESQTFRSGVLAIGFAFESLYAVIKSFAISAYSTLKSFGKGVLNLFEGISLMIRGAFSKDPEMISDGWAKANAKVEMSFDNVGLAVGRVYDKYDKLANNSKPLKLLSESDFDFNFNLGNGGFEKVTKDAKTKIAKAKEKIGIALEDFGQVFKQPMEGLIFSANSQIDQLFPPDKIAALAERMKAVPATLVTGLSDAQIAIQEKGIEFENAVNNLIREGMIEGLTQSFEAMGGAIAQGGNILQAAGGAILGVLGQFMQMLGKEMIKLAVATIALGNMVKGIKKWIVANPGAAIALAGVAIVAGALLSTAGSNIGSGGSSGGGSYSTSSGNSSQSFSSNYSSGGNSGTLSSGTVVFEIEGQKLVGVLSNTLSRNKRLGGSLGIE